MLKHVLVFLCFAFFARITALSIHHDTNHLSDVNPFALIDDARAAIHQLNLTVLDVILPAHDQLSDLAYEIVGAGINNRLQSQIDINQESISNQQSLDDIKILSGAAGKNISVCLGENEAQLISLPSTTYIQVNSCIADSQRNHRTFLSQEYYNIDVTFNVVQLLSAQLGQCAGSEDCFQSVIDQSANYSVIIPGTVRKEVDKALDQTDVTKTEIRLCADNGLAEYVHAADVLLKTITDCVSSILS